ncbi:MAG: peptidoglycan editing factor PgeF [Bacteroidetes bacterium]|nr:MAG: peptidoglycan editing factor PgeF [Bacteroidota bacterium]
MQLYRQPAIFQNIAALVAAESTRHGGISLAPYHSLNLGKNTQDKPEHVAENRQRFCSALGFHPGQLAWSHQVHGAEVRLVTEPGGASGFDALITRESGILLSVSVADCTPVLVYDTRQQAMAAIHAGWRSAAAGIVRIVLHNMQKAFGSRAVDCLAYVGTCIDECSFEVGPEVAAAFEAGVKRFDPESSKYFVDLKKECTRQLQEAGLPESQIEVSPYSTVLHYADYFSHRRENGTTGRMLAVIGRTG